MTRLTLVDGCIEAAWWGPASSLRPVVLLHGGLGSVSTWRHRLVLPDCGHAPHRDHRDRVISAMAALLRSRA